jgi:diguanylate cyclase (GGDEF)-like protein
MQKTIYTLKNLKGIISNTIKSLVLWRLIGLLSSIIMDVIKKSQTLINQLIIFLVALLLPVQLFAIELTLEEMEYLKKTGSVKACVDPDWYPFERINEKGEHEGIAGDLLRLVAKRIGINLEIVKTASWDESIQAIKDKKCQILSFLNQTPQRDEWLFFSEPYFTDVNVFITRNEHAFISDPATLTNQTIVLPEQTAMNELIKKDYPNLKIINTVTENEAFILVSDNKVDMTMRSLIIAAYTIRKEGLFNLKIAGQLPNYTNKLRVGIIKSEPLLVNIINKGIRTITNQEREEIINRHVSIEIKSRIDYRLILEITSIFLLLILVSFYWNYHLRKLNKKLVEISQTDVLTNLYNRTKLDQQFHIELRRAYRYNRPFSVIMLDIDHFKKINDEFGHLIGDKVLIDFAKLLKKCIRHCDIIGRWGGEEFLVLCSETELKDAIFVAERIRKAVKEHQFSSDHQHTISADVASFVRDDTEDSLLQRADAALYKAKNNGRNKVYSI